MTQSWLMLFVNRINETQGGVKNSVMRSITTPSVRLVGILNLVCIRRQLRKDRLVGGSAVYLLERIHNKDTMWVRIHFKRLTPNEILVRAHVTFTSVTFASRPLDIINHSCYFCLLNNSAI